MYSTHGGNDALYGTLCMTTLCVLATALCVWEDWVQYELRRLMSRSADKPFIVVRQEAYTVRGVSQRHVHGYVYEYEID